MLNMWNYEDIKIMVEIPFLTFEFGGMTRLMILIHAVMRLCPGTSTRSPPAGIILRPLLTRPVRLSHGSVREVRSIMLARVYILFGMIFILLILMFDCKDILYGLIVNINLFARTNNNCLL